MKGRYCSCCFSFRTWLEFICKACSFQACWNSTMWPCRIFLPLCLADSFTLVMLPLDSEKWDWKYTYTLWHGARCSSCMHGNTSHYELSIKLYLSSSQCKINHHVSSSEDPMKTFLLEWSQTALTCSGTFLNLITPRCWNSCIWYIQEEQVLSYWTQISNIFISGKRKQAHIVLFMEFILSILHYRDASLNQLLQSEEQSSIPAYALCAMCYLYWLLLKARV